MALTPTKTKAAKPKATRSERKYTIPERMRAAYMAGEGKSSRQISDAIGDTTKSNVRRMLRYFDIHLKRAPNVHQETISFTISAHEFRAMRAVADECDFELGELALELLRILTKEPVLLANLLDDGEENAE